MPDIKIFWDVPQGRGDWQLLGADLATGDDLATAVLVSLFSDRQADPDDALPAGVTDRRGWWADTATDRIGSKIWLTTRSKATADVPNRVRRCVLEALQWIVDDGVAQTVEATVAWLRSGVLGTVVTITRRDGTAVALKFDWAWETL